MKPKRKRASSAMSNNSSSVGMKAIPQSMWMVVNTQKSQKLKNIFTAKLVHHRLYQVVQSTSYIQH